MAAVIRSLPLHRSKSSSIWKVREKDVAVERSVGRLLCCYDTNTGVSASPESSSLVPAYDRDVISDYDHVKIGSRQAPTPRTLNCSWHASTARVVRVNTNVKS